MHIALKKKCFSLRLQFLQMGRSMDNSWLAFRSRDWTFPIESPSSLPTLSRYVNYVTFSTGVSSTLIGFSLEVIFLSTWVFLLLIFNTMELPEWCRLSVLSCASWYLLDKSPRGGGGAFHQAFCQCFSLTLCSQPIRCKDFSEICQWKTLTKSLMKFPPVRLHNQGPPALMWGTTGLPTSFPCDTSHHPVNGKRGQQWV